MSYDLRIWEQPADRPPPATLEDAGRAMLALEGQRPGVNPKFVALGKKMAARFPTASRDGARDDEAVWMSDPAVEVESLNHAVWVVAIPPDNRVPVTFFVVETATALGLTVLDEQLGMAFLPGGRVLPEEKSSLWEALRAEMGAQPEAPSVTKADMRKATAAFLYQAIEKHGFRLDPTDESVDIAFSRDTPAGRQTIEMTLDGTIPDLRCRIYCSQRNEQVEAIYGDFRGTRPVSRQTLSFNVGSFIGTFTRGIAFGGTKEIKSIMALVEGNAMPALELSRSLVGLNELMNIPERFPLTYEYLHPISPRSLSDWVRSQSARPIVVAWLVRDPRLDSFAGGYRELMRKEGRPDSEAELDKLLAYLGDRHPPDVEGLPPRTA